MVFSTGSLRPLLGCAWALALLSAAAAVSAQALILFEEIESPTVRAPSALLWSGDGRHAYLTGAGAIDFFAVAADEELRYLESEFDHDLSLGSDSALLTTAALLSPEDRHLYVLSRRQLVIFDRDPASGRLENRRQLSAGSGLPTPELRQLKAATMSDDGQVLLVLEQHQDQVLSFERDPTSGDLTLLGSWPTQDLPRDLAIVGSLVVVSGGGSLKLYRLQDGLLESAGSWDLNLEQQRALLAVDGYLYVAHRGGIAVASLEPSLTLHQDLRLGADGATPLGAIDRLAVDPTGRSLYAAGQEGLVVFERDAGSGLLSTLQSVPVPVDRPFQGWPLSVSSSGETVVAIDSISTRFDRDVGDSRLGSARELGPSAVLSGASELAATPDGRDFYAFTNSRLFQTHALRRDPASGRLQQLFTATRERYVGPGVFSPDGRFYYALGANRLTVSERDSESGQLAQVFVYQADAEGLSRAFGIPGAQSLRFAADGRQLYVLTRDDPGDGFSDSGAVAVLSRDPQTGALSPAQLAGVEEVFNQYFGAFSPDGRFLYSVGVSDSGLGSVAEPELSFWRRDLATGQLTLISRQLDSERLWISSMAVSPDGRYLLAKTTRVPSHSQPPDRHGLLVYRLDPDSGEPTLLHDYVDSHPSGFELERVGSLIFDPRGDRVYTRSAAKVLVLSWDGDAGDLALEAELPTRLGFGFGSRLVVSTNGARLYLLGGHGISVFRRPCEAATDRQCLRDDRFQIDVDWRTSRGRTGRGRTVEVPSVDSALLWFFERENWEMLVKVLNGCGRNGHFWLFAAATTNVEYNLRLTDTWTGESRHYLNQQGISAPAVTDTFALPSCEAAPAAGEAVPALLHQPAAAAAKQACDDDPDVLCLREDRFRVSVSWRNFRDRTGISHVVPADADDSGVLWFFQRDNWEMLVKVLDGCERNGHFWLFSAATTTVEYDLRVLDTWTGEERIYSNPLHNAASAVTDTRAFATCGAPAPG